MKFSDITEHLSKRGFATRRKWKGCSFIYFGMDNLAWMAQKAFDDIPNRKTFWTPCAADMYADDWEIIDLFWDSPNDDYKPWNKGE